MSEPERALRQFAEEVIILADLIGDDLVLNDLARRAREALAAS